MPLRHSGTQGVRALVADPKRQACAAALARQRQRLAALPAHIRSYVRVSWGRSPRPRTPENLSDLITHACVTLGACSADFPGLDQEVRRSVAARLNDQARLGDADANCSRQFSSGVEAWLNYMPPQSSNDPDLLEARRNARLSALWRALARCVSFDDHAERRTGRVAVDGCEFRFGIHYLRPGGCVGSDVPWNADVTARILLVALPGEQAELQPGEH